MNSRKWLDKVGTDAVVVSVDGGMYASAEFSIRDIRSSYILYLDCDTKKERTAAVKKLNIILSEVGKLKAAIEGLGEKDGE